VCPSSFIDRRRVCRIPQALHDSKALKHGHCRVRTSSIGADRGDDGIWIYGLTGSFTIIAGKIASASRKFSSSTNKSQIASERLISMGRSAADNVATYSQTSSLLLELK
jgi:hypothetical protein